MKVAIYGQYYLISTEPIIKDIFIFFNKNNVEIVIEAHFLDMLYDKKIVEKDYKTFSSYSELDSSFDMMISIGAMNEIIQTFRRYNFEIISEHQEDLYINNLKERSDYLNKYLSI